MEVAQQIPVGRRALGILVVDMGGPTIGKFLRNVGIPTQTIQINLGLLTAVSGKIHHCHSAL